MKSSKIRAHRAEARPRLPSRVQSPPFRARRVPLGFVCFGSHACTPRPCITKGPDCLAADNSPHGYSPLEHLPQRAQGSLSALRGLARAARHRRCRIRRVGETPNGQAPRTHSQKRGHGDHASRPRKHPVDRADRGRLQLVARPPWPATSLGRTLKWCHGSLTAAPTSATTGPIRIGTCTAPVAGSGRASWMYWRRWFSSASSSSHGCWCGSRSAGSGPRTFILFARLLDGVLPGDSGPDARTGWPVHVELDDGARCTRQPQQAHGPHESRLCRNRCYQGLLYADHGNRDGSQTCEDAVGFFGEALLRDSGNRPDRR